MSAKFPIEYISYSAMSLFSTNPLMFRIRYVNRDRFNSTQNISAVIGKAFHHGLNVYWGCSEDHNPKNEADAVKMGMVAALEYMEKFPEGFIEWSKRVSTRTRAKDIVSLLYNSYVQEMHWGMDDKIIGGELKFVEPVEVEWNGEALKLPLPSKVVIDKLSVRDGKLIITDFKSCSSFSDPEKIDGKKIIQAIHYFFAVYSKYGVKPYSMVYEEVKGSKNRDGSSQLKLYEIVYDEHPHYFEFYLRFYNDFIRGISGEMVYVPNIETFYDNEVGIISYIHRLDSSEEQKMLMEKYKVDNLCDLLKKKMENTGNMLKLLKTVEKKFVTAKSIDYNSMENHEKISVKLMEYAMILHFDSKIDGATVDLYRYNPSMGVKMSRIENYVKDIEQVLGVDGVRVLAPIPNSTMVGFEVPKKKRYFPALTEPTKTFDIKVGLDIMGEEKLFDLRDAPHMLVAGETGSGKSVFLNSLITQLTHVEDVELHLYDPKQIELFHFEQQAADYQTDYTKINKALEELVLEMELRYEQMRRMKVRDIKDMPGLKYKYVIIDEFADLMMNNKDVVQNVLLLAQKARAAGIHLIIATQRPSADVIKGTIRANFPVKAVFKVSTEINSRIVFDQNGAEKLKGKGDFLFVTSAGVERLQGFNV